MTKAQKEKARLAAGKAAHDAMQPATECDPTLTREEYFEAVNKLLETATPAGAFSLGVFEATRRSVNFYPTMALIEHVARCASEEYSETPGGAFSLGVFEATRLELKALAGGKRKTKGRRR